jgi:hypothetical protein
MAVRVVAWEILTLHEPLVAVAVAVYGVAVAVAQRRVQLILLVAVAVAVRDTPSVVLALVAV